MELEALKDRTIVLFGKPRALGETEFGQLLRAAHIRRAEQWQDGVAAVIEGRLVNPLEQAELDRLYAEHSVVPVDINTFEKALCSQLEPERIMMSLKLSRDRERLHAFLQNPYIDDDFFLKLLAMYDWQHAGFFETDANRDVTAALIGRFYENIERNHNVQYSTLGLMHLLQQNRHPELPRTLGALPPLRRAVTTGDRQLRAILEALAIHPAADDATLKHFVRQGDDALRALVAARPGLSTPLQRELAGLHAAPVDAALAANPDLTPDLVDTLFENRMLAEKGYASIRLDGDRFEKGLPAFARALAANPFLTEAMQRNLAATEAADVLAANPALRIADTLQALGRDDVQRALAANPSVAPEQLETLAETGAYDAELAANPAAPDRLLEALSAKGNADVLQALASNPSTPVSILQQLQLDGRFERAVRANEAFGLYIQRENIGWL